MSDFRWDMLPGDPAQQKRRREMMANVERPEGHLSAAWTALRCGLRAVGNQPDREFANCIKEMQRALELGWPPDDLDLMALYSARWAGEPEDLIVVWRIVATALEAEAISRAQPTLDAMAHSEANAAMEPA